MNDKIATNTKNMILQEGLESIFEIVRNQTCFSAQWRELGGIVCNSTRFASRRAQLPILRINTCCFSLVLHYRVYRIDSFYLIL